MVFNKPRDQTGCRELKGQVISDKINFSRGKNKAFFFQDLYNKLCKSMVEGKVSKYLITVWDKKP